MLRLIPRSPNVPARLLSVFSSLALGLSSTLALEVPGWDEPADPDPHDPSQWGAVDPGIHSGFGSTDIAYPKSLPPAGEIRESIRLQGWKGERVSCKLLVWSRDDKAPVRVGMRGPGGGDHGIDARDVSISVVKYVLTDQFLNEEGRPCGPRENHKVPVHLAPDILSRGSSFTFDSAGTRPFWISIDIPSDAPAGLCSGMIEVHSPTNVGRHEIRLEVLDRRLPPPRDWRFHLDLWQNPFAVARYHGVEPWSAEHMRLLRPHLTMLANAGQKCITTTLIDRPWGDGKPCHDDHRSMIRWTRKKDGSWEYDYRIFDRYVGLAMDCGITKQINGYTMVPIDNRFTWFDEESSTTVTKELLPGTQEYEAHWRPFLADFRNHLRDRGWLDRTTIALDERGEEEMARMLRFVQEAAPGFKVAAAGFHHPGIHASIHDFSSNWREEFRIPVETIRERKAAGLITTYYVACGIPRPNNFTFSPPAESCFQGWMASSMGFDGFLRWAYHSWPERPLVDSRYIKWPAGDTYFIYPGPLSSIRFERLREGIQDYEKIRILRAALAKDHSPRAATLLRELGGFLDTIGPDTLEDIPAAEVTTRGKRLLHRISKAVP